MYAVKEIFLTLQGEGARAGTAAVFVRLAGCNLWNGQEAGRKIGLGECARWCDTNFVGGVKLSEKQIVERVRQLWRSNLGASVVITGGEPTLQLDERLVDAMHAAGMFVAIETNGTIDNPALKLVDHVCVSPKLGSKRVVITRAHELKVVLPGSVDPDSDWTDEKLMELGDSGSWFRKYVQPLDFAQVRGLIPVERLVGNRDALRRCIDFVERHPGWWLSMQQHKLIGLP